MDERGASEGMSGAGSKRPADLSLALPIAKRAKRLDQSAWDEALNDHRAASEIGWVCFPPSLRLHAAAAARRPGSRRGAPIPADCSPEFAGAWI
jgi:hypothetical protein